MFRNMSIPATFAATLLASGAALAQMGSPQGITPSTPRSATATPQALSDDTSAPGHDMGGSRATGMPATGGSPHGITPSTPRSASANPQALSPATGASGGSTASGQPAIGGSPHGITPSTPRSATATPRALRGRETAPTPSSASDIFSGSSTPGQSATGSGSASSASSADAEAAKRQINELLQSAQRSLRQGNWSAANTSLERAETSWLNSQQVNAASASTSPPDGFNRANEALRARNRDGAMSAIQEAMNAVSSGS